MTLPADAQPVVAPIPRALLRTLQTPLLRTLQNPLLRNGHLLTLSSTLTALIGLGYWAVAAWKYDAATVGRNSAAISMMMFLCAIAQLDLGSAMVRFVPTAGRHTTRLVACTYLASASLAVVISLGFLGLARGASSGVTFFDEPLVGASFVFATLVATLFAIQDSVLTGLRRTAWVPLKNAMFAVAKLALVVVLAAAIPTYGIFASWVLSMGGMVLITNVYLFRWAVPHHQQENHDHGALPPARQIVQFVGASYVGGVCSIASITLMPILVINVLGPRQNAHFALAWIIAYSVHLININMGASLVVETAVDQSQLAHNCRQVLVHISKLLVPVVLILMLLAPYLLSIFGDDYRSATGLLLLLTLASLPHLVIVTAVNSARVQGRMSLVVSVQGAQCVLALGLGWILLHVVGLAGAGLAWLLTLSLIAGILLLRRDLWLTVGNAPAALSRGTRAQLPWWRLSLFGVRVASALGIQRWLQATLSRLHERRVRNDLHALLPDLLPTVPALPGRPDPATWTNVQPIRTLADLTVAVLSPEEGPPAAVLKVANSAEALHEMRVQRDALAVLSADPQLEDWRNLLPQVIAFQEDGNPPVALEVFLPEGDLATVLTREPDSFERLMTTALGSIVPLHRRTGRTEVVDQTHLARWVDEPLESLRQSCLARSPASITTVELLGEMLRAALMDRRVQVSWTHGDFSPGNVLLVGDRVGGIVDWGGARPGQLSLLDGYLMVIAACCCVQRRELGTIVVRLLRAGGLPERERRLLEHASVPPSDAVGCDVPEQRALILLTWLHHVAELQRKCGRYREHRIWWMCNVEPVLRTLTTMPHDIEAGRRARDVLPDRSIPTQLVQCASETSSRYLDSAPAPSLQVDEAIPTQLIPGTDEASGHRTEMASPARTISVTRGVAGRLWQIFRGRP